MECPKELSLVEIRNFMLENNCKVTNHALVKHFKRFLTNPETQNEARKQFKTYVNTLSTIKNENNQKFLILRKKYLTKCPENDIVLSTSSSATDSFLTPESPDVDSMISERDLSIMNRQPPPYKPPPDFGASPKHFNSIQTIAKTGTGINPVQVENYRNCVDEFSTVVLKSVPEPSVEKKIASQESTAALRKKSADEQSKMEIIPRFSFSSGTSSSSTDSTSNEKRNDANDCNDNPMSVKEATRKFNRMASEEEAKVISPSSKKKHEENIIEEKSVPEVTLAHPKAKEWIVAMAKASYQELAKLALEYPELVKLQDPATGYTVLHWAAKHGNEDVIKLIAGNYNGDVNARTNGGYTPLHLAMQFGRVDIFELLCNVYKANRDIMDWSGNKPLDYTKQRTSVSASTYSKIKAKKKQSAEKDLGFLRIGSLNVRVKKTTEAFSNFLGVGNGNMQTQIEMNVGRMPSSLSHQRSHRHRPPHHHHHHHGTTRTRHQTKTTLPSTMGKNNQNSRVSAPTNSKVFEKFHKTWGSADNITQNNDSKDIMPPPETNDIVRKRQKSIQSIQYSSANDSPRDSISSSNSSSNLNSGYSSMPSTPNQIRSTIGNGLQGSQAIADSDSDSACGFDASWSGYEQNSSSSNSIMQNSRFP